MPLVIKLNGELQVIDTPRLTISDLLAHNNVQAPQMVSVQRNGEFVDRAEYASTAVANDDEIDFLYFMGGGSR